MPSAFAQLSQLSWGVAGGIMPDEESERRVDKENSEARGERQKHGMKLT